MPSTSAAARCVKPADRTSAQAAAPRAAPFRLRFHNTDSNIPNSHATAANIIWTGMPSLTVLQEPLSVPVILENGTPLIAACGHMINRARELNPEQPRHSSDSIPNATELSI